MINMSFNRKFLITLLCNILYMLCIHEILRQPLLYTCTDYHWESRTCNTINYCVIRLILKAKLSSYVRIKLCGCRADKLFIAHRGHSVHLSNKYLIGMTATWLRHYIHCRHGTLSVQEFDRNVPKWLNQPEVNMRKHFWHLAWELFP